MKQMILLFIFFSTFNLYAADVKVLNDEIKSLFKDLRPTLQKRISNELNAQVSKALLENKDKKFKVLSTKIVKNNVLNYPLKFYKIDDTGFVIGTPEENPWALSIHARVQYEGKFLNTKKNIKIRIKNMSFKLNLDWSIDKNRKITIHKHYVTDNNLETSIGASNPLLSGTLKFAKIFVDKKIKKTFNDALKKGVAKIASSLTFNEALRVSTPDNLKYPVDNHDTNDLLTTILNIENKIVKYNLEYGQIVGNRFTEDDRSSWNEAFGPEGSGQKGEVEAVTGFGDAGIWSGTYLASQAFRFSVMKDNDSLNSVKRALGGVENLLGVNGFTGLLSRAAAPIDSKYGKGIQTKKFFSTTNYKGQTWVHYHGDRNGISRDQYTGVIFGLSIAYDHVSDPLIKKKCAYLLRIILDYIIKNNWLVFEDRGDLTTPRSISNRTSFPSQWFMINYQRLNMLIIGEHVHPGRYTKELEKFSSLSETAELFLYASSMDNHNGYYKFNLFYTNIYNYFRLEKNEKRKQDLKNAFDMVNTHIGHHDNSYFNLIHYTIAPDEVSTEKRTRIKTNIFRLLERSHRMVPTEAHGRSDIEYTTIPGRHPGDADVTISKYPLDVRLRKSAGSFFWQKSPYSVAPPVTGGRPKLDISGIDITLIYWMGRFHNVH